MKLTRMQRDKHFCFGQDEGKYAQIVSCPVCGRKWKGYLFEGDWEDITPCEHLRFFLSATAGHECLKEGLQHFGLWDSHRFVQEVRRRHGPCGMSDSPGFQEILEQIQNPDIDEVLCLEEDNAPYYQNTTYWGIKATPGDVAGDS